MWMQILANAGLPVVGQAFPTRWRQVIGDANPRGFFESTLITGVNFTTNPDPHSGVRLDPESSRDLVLKVFLLGVPRTEFKYLDAVLVTTREWRAFVASAQRLNSMQESKGVHPAKGKEVTASELAIKWFVDHYKWVHDQRLRGYPCRAISYESVLTSPEVVIPDILDWFGQDCDVQKAIETVEPSLRTQHSPPTPDGIEPQWVRVFDELYLRIHEGRGIDAPFMRHMVEVNQAIHELCRPSERWD